MGIQERFGGSRDTSPSGQQAERWAGMEKAIRRANSAEEIAEMLKTNELGIEVDLERMRNPNFQADATTEDLLYDWSTIPISNPGNEDISAQEAMQVTVMEKLKEFGYQPPEAL